MNKIEDAVDNLNIKGIDVKSYFNLKPSIIMELKNTIILINADRNVSAGQKNQQISELIINNLYTVKQFYSIRNDDKDEIWIYDEGIYIPNGKSFIEQFCRVLLESNHNQNIYRLCCDKIRADNYIDADEFFKKEQESPELIPVQNGILNLKTRELIDFNPDYIFFSKINAIYDPNATCPNIDKFLKEVLKSPEDRKIFYEMVGSSLYKEYYLQTAFMLLGDGENGKGISLGIIQDFLGSNNYSSLQLNNISGDGFRLYELFGKLANIAGDLSNTDLKETGSFKSVTSGTDFLSADRKFKNSVSFINYATMIFACNELPRVYDNSRGFWRRWKILEYPYTFLKPNEYKLRRNEENVKVAENPSNLKEKLSSQNEMSGLLNLSLDGLQRLFNNKQYSSTESTDQVKDLWVRKSDSFQAFCMDCIEENYEEVVEKKVLRRTFNAYCKKHKIKGCSDRNIKYVLQELYGATESRKSILGEQEHVWEGIFLKKPQKKIKEFDAEQEFEQLIGEMT